MSHAPDGGANFQAAAVTSVKPPRVSEGQEVSVKSLNYPHKAKVLTLMYGMHGWRAEVEVQSLHWENGPVLGMWVWNLSVSDLYASG